MKFLKINNGDKIKGNFELFINGHLNLDFSGIREIEIGQNSYLPDFDERLINRKVKKEMEVKFIFSKDYPIVEFQRKEAIVVIKNLEIAKNNTNSNFETQELLTKIKELELKLAEKESQLKITEYTFKQKAEEITSKANEKIESLRKEIEEKNKLELAQNKEFALARFVEDFEVPFNNFKLAMNIGANSEDPQVKNYCIGFNLIANQFNQVLEDHGILLIEPKIGQEFNPYEEEAIDFQNDVNLANNTIVKVVKPGLKIGTRIIKPASVVLNKNN
ncbi:nucleotide exchange factor GrpE [Mycoplasmopsis gallopavonis]|uniref:Protein GrpE n=1 Tax=Mycoplasmopsis gallopavonis TaxID=76629 RepID=A0A449B0G5_9BACT|nr:nucleotide exchange factor GrpE [Mycoplasmopsis gallopavonis]RIV16768.1 nucleotide exchange factor GrpE [Mycoplasmopsis gallopavonis]VEU73263.1 Chaperone protein GrpE [Mycoplasmopsis gallopavonis]